MYLEERDIIRFLKKIDKNPQGPKFDPILYSDCNENCWRYIGHLNKQNYGQFAVRKKSYMAHRVSYYIYKGPIPDGLQLRHICDNQWCVNPDHLIPGTPQEDANDRKLRDKQSSGSQVNTAILHESDILEIIEGVEKGKYTSIKQLCEHFPISTVSMRKIFTGENWKQVTSKLDINLNDLYLKLSNPSKGITYHSCKLREIDVLLIRQRITNGETLQSIADDVGVSRTLISNIKNNKLWKSV